MKIIGGYEQPSSGRVLFDGLDISGLRESDLVNFRRNNVGMIFQDYYLDENLTFKENIELPAVFANLSATEMETRTDELTADTDLADRMSHYPVEISGGQAQRAAIMRAIYLKPKLVLADEPTSNLDDHNAKHVLKLLKDLQRRGHTIIIASHDSRVLPYADLELKLENGALL